MKNASPDGHKVAADTKLGMVSGAGLILTWCYPFLKLDRGNAMRSGFATRSIISPDQERMIHFPQIKFWELVIVQTENFFLRKAYVSGMTTIWRSIALPVNGTVRVAIDGIELIQDADFEVDHLTGKITFTLAPATDAVVTAGFIFDVPVRFDTDSLMVGARHGVGDIPNIPLAEVRLS